MKSLFALTISVVLFQVAFGGKIEEGLWEQLAKTKARPTIENIINLADEIAGNYKNEYLLTPEAHAATNEVRDELCKIPGHAEFIGRRIRRAYEPLRGPDFKNHIASADGEITYAFATLKHLPSPENVKVLGGMLSETWRLPRPPEVQHVPLALAEQAMTTLGGLGIRDAPWRPIVTTNDLPGAILAWQAWYEDVKSGGKTFSFKGQKVEYRFKADGTWETIALVSPPDDGPKPPKAENVDRKRPADPPASNWISAHSSSWAWIIGGTLALLAIVVWLGVTRR